MKSIYFDGNKHYTIGKYKDGGYYKVEVDDIGNYKHGGSIHKYNNIADMNMDMSKMYEKGGIHIKPENRGKFTALKAKTGKTTEELTHSSNPAVRKMAVFAQNAAKWHHENGGLLKAQMGLTIPDKYKLAGAEVDFNPNQYYGETVPHDNRWGETLAERDYKIAMNPNFDNKNLPSNYGHLGRSMSNIMGKTSSMADALNNSSNIPDSRSNQLTSNNQPAISNKSTPANTGFNPYKLSTYGNRIAENALNRTTAFNLASSLLEPAYQNPLIVPDFKFKRQFVQADYQPIYEMQNVGMRNIANNARSTAALMGNMQQLNANMVKAKSDISRKAQLEQLGKDAQFDAQKQAYANQLAQARQNVENLNKADLAEKRQYLSDTFTNWMKAEVEKSKLYNTELQNWNQINTYVNQLSPEYKAERNHKTGELSIVFKSNGKPVPNAELEKAKAQYQARLNSTNTVNNGNVNFTNPTLPSNSTSNYTYTLPNRKFKHGGKLTEVSIKPSNKIKKLRTGLY